MGCDLSQTWSVRTPDAISEEEAEELEEWEEAFNNTRPSTPNIVEEVINEEEIAEFDWSDNHLRDRGYETSENNGSSCDMTLESKYKMGAQVTQQPLDVR